MEESASGVTSSGGRWNDRRGAGAPPSSSPYPPVIWSTRPRARTAENSDQDSLFAENDLARTFGRIQEFQKKVKRLTQEESNLENEMVQLDRTISRCMAEVEEAEQSLADYRELQHQSQRMLRAFEARVIGAKRRFSDLRAFREHRPEMLREAVEDSRAALVACVDEFNELVRSIGYTHLLLQEGDEPVQDGESFRDFRYRMHPRARPVSQEERKARINRALGESREAAIRRLEAERQQVPIFGDQGRTL